jgi:O-methyltransferase
MGEAGGALDTAAGLYLDLLKKCLTRSIFDGGCVVPLADFGTDITHKVLADPEILRLVGAGEMQIILRAHAGGIKAVLRGTMSPEARAEGRDWPFEAETMVGLKRLDNLQHCVTDVLVNKVPGDLVETGVWRGGSSIFMRACLKAYGDRERRVWVADSFAGLPAPDAKQYPADKDLDLSGYPELAISLDTVKGNFAKYGLLDDQVSFLVGWFKDTLASAPINSVAVLRLDGDLYESTMDTLRALYHKVSIGGYIIVDDYLALTACEQATEDFRREKGITAKVHAIDWAGVYWQKEA